MALNSFFNFIFGPLLTLPDAVAVIIISLIISVLIIVITKFTTNQQIMKNLKEEMKEYQKKMKESRSDPAKALELHKKAMEVNLKYMSYSLKPTLITMIPIFLIFGWMNSTFAYQNINPSEEFAIIANFAKDAQGHATIEFPKDLELLSNSTQQIIDRKTRWLFKGKEGEHFVTIKYENEEEQKKILITKDDIYADPIEEKNGKVKSIQIEYKKNIVLPIGYRNWFGWLGTYIIFSIIFTMILRKIFKVY